MHAPVTMPLLRRMVRGLAYVVFQLALFAAFLLRSVGALQFPLRFHSAAEDSQDVLPTRRTLPSARLKTRPAL
ncbi:hypothetical protein J0X19_08040 [Hymenobacter sp. BT186]|uniref:Uncharacterized protein n=1 Tax=Hymenobacter telluris TaxID=2816474 RepID=A0A939EVP6_9BACT|nr:hypothetical protein [Hymenobacter telluris]MBO0357891.1 hypothetical protein [Hymenobacter telluris]MBW3373918.1 hypothetical protein [Hymenobacter norwichensis]